MGLLPQASPEQLGSQKTQVPLQANFSTHLPGRQMLFEQEGASAVHLEAKKQAGHSTPLKMQGGRAHTGVSSQELASLPRKQKHNRSNFELTDLAVERVHCRLRPDSRGHAAYDGHHTHSGAEDVVMRDAYGAVAPDVVEEQVKKDSTTGYAKLRGPSPTPEGVFQVGQATTHASKLPLSLYHLFTDALSPCDVPIRLAGKCPDLEALCKALVRFMVLMLDARLSAVGEGLQSNKKVQIRRGLNETQYWLRQLLSWWKPPGVSQLMHMIDRIFDDDATPLEEEASLDHIAILAKLLRHLSSGQLDAVADPRSSPPNELNDMACIMASNFTSQVAFFSTEVERRRARWTSQQGYMQVLQSLQIVLNNRIYQAESLAETRAAVLHALEVMDQKFRRTFMDMASSAQQWSSMFATYARHTNMSSRALLGITEDLLLSASLGLAVMRSSMLMSISEFKQLLWPLCFESDSHTEYGSIQFSISWHHIIHGLLEASGFDIGSETENKDQKLRVMHAGAMPFTASEVRARYASSLESLPHVPNIEMVDV